MLNAGEVLNGRYMINKVIGKGGMSTVYQAKDLVNGTLLAIKDVERTGKDGNQAVEQSLVTEGRMLKALSNPHLPRIYEIIENADSFLMVMDFIQGDSLDKVIKREGAQSMDKVLDWGMQICEVFDYLHNQPKPIIYRDMKPANLMLQPDGKLMMIDFGTARTQKVNVAMATDTMCLGTAGFAAPEQFGGYGQSTARTDIYCLGATLYNMITGHSPCDRPQGILPLEQWNPALKDTPISHIIRKCTQNQPAARYQSARELHEDLRRARMGTFGTPAPKASTGKVTGGSGRDFQKQTVKTGGITSGLSGLLPFGKNTAEKGKSGQLPTPVVQGGGPWQGGAQSPAVSTPAAPHPAPTATVQRQQTPWKKLTLISLAAALVMLILGAVLIVLSQQTAGLVFMIIALVAAALAVMGVVLAKGSED